MSNNDELQQEELLVLRSMFSPEEFYEPNKQNKYYMLKVKQISTLKWTLNRDYPSESPVDLSIDISERFMKRNEVVQMESKLKNSFSKGQTMILTCFELLSEEMELLQQQQNNTNTNMNENDQTTSTTSNNEKEIQIAAGEPVTDRKSTFQAFLSVVHNVEETKQMLRQLMTNKKIATATHNMFAFRFRDSQGKIVSWRDDDGETGAGDKLLDLLELMKVENVMVVVSRQFGGILLGNDRFKHIVNTAKELLLEKIGNTN